MMSALRAHGLYLMNGCAGMSIADPQYEWKSGRLVMLLSDNTLIMFVCHTCAYAQRVA